MTPKTVNAVLDEVRPYLIADGGNVEVAGVEDGMVFLRLQVWPFTCIAISVGTCVKHLSRTSRWTALAICVLKTFASVLLGEISTGWTISMTDWLPNLKECTEQAQ